MSLLFIFVLLYQLLGLGFACTSDTSLCYRRFRHRNCALLPADSECGPISPKPLVVGGHNATSGRFPWIVAFYSTEENSTKIQIMCGGSVISSRYILSAAHCFVDATFPKARVGAYDLSNISTREGEDVSRDLTVEGVKIHDKYNDETLENDIALVRVEEEIKFNKYVAPVCLPFDRKFARESFLGKDPLEVAGWGQLSELDGDLPRILQTAKVLYMSRRRCKKLAKKLDKELAASVLCAGGDDTRDACHGDSGGPLVGRFSPGRPLPHRYFLVGVVSSTVGDGCGEPGIPGTYTNVQRFSKWILDHMRG